VNTRPRPAFPARLAPQTRVPKAGPPGPPASGGTEARERSARAESRVPARPARGGDALPQGLGLDSGAVRLRMVQRLVAQGLSDAVVTQAMRQVERHRFVDSALANKAYEDAALPIGLGQTISSPTVVARMIELLRGGAEQPLGRVLEIGTGCGYQAAVLSLCAREVYSIERLKALHQKARDNLRPMRLANLHLLFGDGMLGYAPGAPYAAIIAAACGEAIPQAWLEQLAEGGRLVAPVASGADAQSLVLIEKRGGVLHRRMLDRVVFVPLKSGIA
jgi:protein-L-isoaspartate(D-aspartate) O-methyltransferase